MCKVQNLIDDMIAQGCKKTIINSDTDFRIARDQKLGSTATNATGSATSAINTIQLHVWYYTIVATTPPTS